MTRKGRTAGKGWGTPRGVTAPRRRRRGVPRGPPWLASAQCSWFLGWESALGKALRNEGPGRSNDFPKVTRLEKQKEDWRGGWEGLMGIWGALSPSPSLMASLFLRRPGSDGEWREHHAPQGLHGPWAEPAPCWPLPAARHPPGPHAALGRRSSPTPIHLPYTREGGAPRPVHTGGGHLARYRWSEFPRCVSLHYQSSISSPRMHVENTEL